MGKAVASHSHLAELQSFNDLGFTKDQCGDWEGETPWVMAHGVLQKRQWVGCIALFGLKQFLMPFYHFYVSTVRIYTGNNLDGD